MGFTGGTTTFHLISAANNNATLLASNTSTIFGIQCGNINAAPRYLKLYNKATLPTPATDTPSLVVLIPGNANGAGNNFAIGDGGICFNLGLGIAIVTGIADTDNTSVGANEVVINIQF